VPVMLLTALLVAGIWAIRYPWRAVAEGRPSTAAGE
jgi:hypothetical protein